MDISYILSINKQRGLNKMNPRFSLFVSSIIFDKSDFNIKPIITLFVLNLAFKYIT